MSVGSRLSKHISGKNRNSKRKVIFLSKNFVHERKT
jgi:hypothetical protein